MKTHAVTKSLCFDTNIGMFNVSVSIEPEVSEEMHFSLIEKMPFLKLPKGMSVDRCRAALLQIRTKTPIKHMFFSCFYKGSISGNPCTGEYLDAQEWENNTNTVCVGTEDIEMLKMRLPFFESYNCTKLPTTFSANSMVMHLSKISANSDISMHFIIAENSLPESIESSAWYAVDYPHSSLLL